MQYWDFEKPIKELETRIEELRKFAQEKKVNLDKEIESLEEKLKKIKKDIYTHLTPWQKVQMARHSQRPTTLDYINIFIKDFIELHGDRLFRDDLAIVGGLGELDNEKVVIIGHQKGKDINDNIKRNFGCAHPEGYRKAKRLMELGDRFGLPIICFIDTPGAYPGIGAEERGQAQAIAENIRDMFEIRTPIIVTVIGEGGSGGALGIGVGDRILMLEHAYYSVISPEGCAAILWKNSSKKEEAASVLKLTAQDLLALGIIDEIVPEPEGGAHRDYQKVAENLKASLLKHLCEVKKLSYQERLKLRYEKYRKIGVFKE